MGLYDFSQIVWFVIYTSLLLGRARSAQRVEDLPCFTIFKIIPLVEDAESKETGYYGGGHTKASWLIKLD